MDKKSFFNNSEKIYNKPVIIVGSRVTRLVNHDEISKFLNDINIPILTTIGAKGIINEDNPYNLLVYTGVGGANTPETKILESNDLVIGLCLRHSDVIKVDSFSSESIFVDFEKNNDSSGFGDNSFFIEDIYELQELFNKYVKSLWTLDFCKKIRSQFLKQILCDENKVGQFLYESSRIIKNDSTCIVDDGVFQKQSEYLWKASNHKNYIATGVGRNMGSALPAAVGLSLTYTNESFICLTGDGGLPLFLGELAMLCNQRHGKLIFIHFADFHLATMREKNLKNVKNITNADMSYLGVFEGFGFKSFKTSSLKEAVLIVSNWDSGSDDIFLEFDLETDQYASTISLIRDRKINL